jgi:hypothetical protein
VCGAHSIILTKGALKNNSGNEGSSANREENIDSQQSSANRQTNINGQQSTSFI